MSEPNAHGSVTAPVFAAAPLPLPDDPAKLEEWIARSRYDGGKAFDGHTHHNRGDGRCATCQTKLHAPPAEVVPFVPDLAFIGERMPKRTDKGAYLVHALRFFEDVLDYAARLEEELRDLQDLAREARADS